MVVSSAFVCVCARARVCVFAIFCRLYWAKGRLSENNFTAILQTRMHVLALLDGTS